MVVTGVTAMQPLMSSGHLAACREPWVEVKLGTPPHTCLEAFTPQEQPSAGFCRDLDRTLTVTTSSGCSLGLSRCGTASCRSGAAPAPAAKICWQARFASILPENPTWPETVYTGR